MHSTGTNVTEPNGSFFFMMAPMVGTSSIKTFHVKSSILHLVFPFVCKWGSEEEFWALDDNWSDPGIYSWWPCVSFYHEIKGMIEMQSSVCFSPSPLWKWRRPRKLNHTGSKRCENRGSAPWRAATFPPVPEPNDLEMFENSMVTLLLALSRTSLLKPDARLSWNWRDNDEGSCSKQIPRGSFNLTLLICCVDFDVVPGSLSFLFKR